MNKRTSSFVVLKDKCVFIFRPSAAELLSQLIECKNTQQFSVTVCVFLGKGYQGTTIAPDGLRHNSVALLL